MCDERGLGDRIAAALETVGVTEDRVRQWLGNCKCSERREKLNQLGNWAARVLSGKVQEARSYLDAILYH